MATFTKVTLASYAVGHPKPENFAFVQESIPTESTLKDGQLLLRVLYLSVDPYMRGRIGPASGTPIGSTITGGSVAEVVVSKHPKFKAGDVLNVYTGWTEYFVIDGDTINEGMHRVDTSLGIPISTFNGTVGMPGLTAYFGLNRILEVQRGSGKTLLVTGAAGAVGAVACQLGKMYGLRVVGFAGSNDKVAFLKSIGVDVALNYKSATFNDDVNAALASGIDYFFENVGGPVSDALIPKLNVRGRIAICGQIFMYNATPGSVELTEPRWLHTLIYKNARVEGFVVSAFVSEFGSALKELAGAVKDGKITVKEDIMEGGIKNAPAAFFKLFNGENFGKQSVHIAESQFGHK